MEALQPRLEGLLTTHMASVVDQATSVTVVLLVALEESQMTSLRVTENICFNVLGSVVLYVERRPTLTTRVLLQCFGVGGLGRLSADKEFQHCVYCKLLH